MEFIAQGILPTSTISIHPPGGTGHPHHGHGHHGHHEHMPLPGGPPGFPHPELKFDHITHFGQVTLWVVFTLFTLGLIGVGIMSARVERKHRIFHWLSFLVLTFAMISYFAMATGTGYAFVPIHESKHAGGVQVLRQVFVARSYDWVLTTPLLLVSLAFLAGLSPSASVAAIIADVLMIGTGYLASLHSGRTDQSARYKWGWFTISCVFFLAIFYILIGGGVAAAKQRPAKTRGLFFLLTAMTFGLWTAYPIVWGLSEGAQIISPNSEVLAYAILDVSAKLGFTYLLLVIHGHGEDDTYVLPDWFVNPRQGTGREGRTGYGAIPDSE